jgi:hypothetical protein
MEQFIYAIENRFKLSFEYQSYSRTVIPCTLGFIKNGKLAIRAKQEWSNKVKSKNDFKIFIVSEIVNIEIGNSFYLKPTGYRKKDSSFIKIIKEL